VSSVERQLDDLNGLDVFPSWQTREVDCSYFTRISFSLYKCLQMFTNEEEGGRKNVEDTSFTRVLTRVDEQQNERIPREEDNSITELTWRESSDGISRLADLFYLLSTKKWSPSMP